MIIFFLHQTSTNFGPVTNSRQEVLSRVMMMIATILHPIKFAARVE